MLETAISKLSKNCNRDELIDLICEAGLVDDKRICYGVYEPYRAGRGEGVYQMPDQMADFLLFIRKFHIRNWIEVGTFNGWHCAFVTSYLRLWNPDLEAHTIDTSKKPNRLKDGKYGIHFHLRDSNYFRDYQFDLVYIDGCHEAFAIQQDFQNLGTGARACAFHDIDDPIAKESKVIYNKLKEGKCHKEFTSYKIMGIGIIYQPCFL